MFKMLPQFHSHTVVTLLAIIAAVLAARGAADAYQPILHLRKAATPPPVVARLENPAVAGAWYPSSPTWFGLGGKSGDRNHTEVLATYDDDALYIALLTIDRSTVFHPKADPVDITTVDSTAIWIQTPAGRRFYFLAALDYNYPPGPRRASGEVPDFDPVADRLPGWSHSGWYAGDKTFQLIIRIPWPTIETPAPEPGSRWAVNFVNYNQTSDLRGAGTVNRQMWAPGDESQPDRWGILSFDDAEPAAAPDVSPEATLIIRPATGFGEEVTLRAGNSADMTNEWPNEAITQSSWNDWDPIDYTIKEFLQFDLSLVPEDRKIISATLQNYCRGNFESDPTDIYLHVMRLDRLYDPKTVTLLTSPLPVENCYRRLIQVSEVGSWIDFDVTDVVSKAYQSGAGKVSLALAGSSGDIHNGKIWNTSFGRADYYDRYRPKLIVTFGQPGVSYRAPISVGSLNYTSLATTSSKNKLTNGTFRYGTVEGHSNTTYWHADPGSVYQDGQNVALMRLAGDVNPVTGNPALRFMTPVNWRSIKQIATGLDGGKTYTFSGWYRGSIPGIKSDLRIQFQDEYGYALRDGQAVYSGSGEWEQVRLTRVAPPNTVKAKVEIVNWRSAPDAYMLYSDLQLEEGTTPMAYSETVGVYYPDYPRTDGIATEHNNCIGRVKKLPLGTSVELEERVVTGSFPGFFYIQCPEKGHFTCGIRVAHDSSPLVGWLVTVMGTLDKDDNDELTLVSSRVAAKCCGVVPSALGCVNRYVGGGTLGEARGPDGGSGLNLVGVLLATAGRVSRLIPGVSMTIDDGSGAPVKVLGPTGEAANGSYVRVEGVAGIEKNGDEHARLLRTRTHEDVRLLAQT